VLRQLRAQGERCEGRAIVLHKTYRGSRRVAACSPTARALGITIAMPLSEATAIAPQATLLAHDPQADNKALQRIGTWCHRFSPLVGLEETDEPECLLLDVTGVTRFFGGEEALAGRIRELFGRHNMPVRIGLADTVGVAWAVAKFSQSRNQKPESGTEDQLECRWLRRRRSSPPQVSASRETSPWSSTTIIPSGKAAEALAPLPPAALRLPERVLDLLGQLGVRRIGELESLPRADFSARFGPELLHRWDQALGRADEPIVALPLPQKFEAEYCFEHPVGDRKTLEIVLRGLVEQTAQMAALAGRGAIRIRSRLHSQASGSTEVDVGLFRPSAVADHLFGLLQLRFERLTLPGQVETVHVELAETARLERHQPLLFDSGNPEDDACLAADLIDRLAGRLGDRAILGVRLLSEAQPEKAYRYESLVECFPRRRKAKSRPARRLPPRPLRLLPRPVRIDAVAVMPDGPPIHFQHQGESWRVERVWGPERIETGWWRGRPIERDYYRVETTPGTRYWLFRRRTDGRWFLHGLF